MKWRVLLTGCLLLFTFTLWAAVDEEQLELAPHPPSLYVVKPSDTLWGIARKYLKNPWQWRRLWEANPQITYHNELFPGDVLELHDLNGRPLLRLLRSRTIKLYPERRVLPLTKPIPTIPIDAIHPYLNRTMAVQKQIIARAPYIVSMVGEHLTGGLDAEIYVRSINTEAIKTYNIFRLGPAYRDPLTKKILAYQATFIGQANLLKKGDPATLNVFEDDSDVMIGDRLLPAIDEKFSASFLPHAPPRPIFADIISVLGDGISEIGLYDSVVLDKGKKQGMEVGDVLDVMTRGHVIVDPLTKRDKNNQHTLIKLPDRAEGLVMVYRTFDDVSFALVMSATEAMHVSDRVKDPDVD